MRKFLSKQDIIVMNKVISNKGDTVIENDTLSSMDSTINIKADINFLSNEDLFEEILGFTIDSKESYPEEEQVIKDWIIQLKVNCNRQKLRIIEDTIKKSVSEILDN